MMIIMFIMKIIFNFIFIYKTCKMSEPEPLGHAYA